MVKTFAFLCVLKRKWIDNLQYGFYIITKRTGKNRLIFDRMTIIL